MSWWNAKYKNDHGEYEITFGSKDYEKTNAVEKLCQAIIDKKVKSVEDLMPVLRGWISVKDALPEVGEMVLACYINPLRKDRPPRMMVGMNPQFSNNKIYLWCGGWRAITHWMPLPEPPEVEA